jgi:hypothetical protein
MALEILAILGRIRWPKGSRKMANGKIMTLDQAGRVRKETRQWPPLTKTP